MNLIEGLHVAADQKFKDIEYQQKSSKTRFASKLGEYLVELKPLTPPYKDMEGRVIQLLKTKQNRSIATVFASKGHLTLIFDSRICNPLNPAQTAQDFAIQLEDRPEHNWDLVFDAQKLLISIWPHLAAAGKEEQLLYLTKMSPSEALAHIESRFEQLTRLEWIKENGERVRLDLDEHRKFDHPPHKIDTVGGALNRFYTTAVRREEKFPDRNPKNKDGTPVLNKRGEPHQHRKKVEGAIRSAKHIIQDLRALKGSEKFKEHLEKVDELTKKISRRVAETERNIKYEVRRSRPLPTIPPRGGGAGGGGGRERPSPFQPPAQTEPGPSPISSDASANWID